MEVVGLLRSAGPLHVLPLDTYMPYLLISFDPIEDKPEVMVSATERLLLLQESMIFINLILLVPL